MLYFDLASGRLALILLDSRGLCAQLRVGSYLIQFVGDGAHTRAGETSGGTMFGVHALRPRGSLSVWLDSPSG
jgi:hypothetical protein